VTTGKWRGEAKGSSGCGGDWEAGVPFIGADGESNGQKGMGHRRW
jgi:hypothetical protein